MIVFDVNEKPKAVRKKFMPGLFIDIFPTSRKDRRRIRKEAGEKAENDPEKEEEIFETLWRQHMVRGWSGFVDPAGEPVVFNKNLIDPIMDSFTSLEMFVITESNTLALSQATEKARKLKNLNSSPDGSEKDPKE